MTIIDIVATLITEDANQVGEFFAAVACVEDNHGRWLLGLSTAPDSRFGCWCFPGGGIEDGETPARAAQRECREEAGVACVPRAGVVTCPDKPGVAFVYCRTIGQPRIKHNREFSDMRLFSINEMKNLKLYPNVRALIRRFY